MKRFTVCLVTIVIANLIGSTAVAWPTAQPQAPRQEDHVYNGSRGDSSGNSDTNLQDLSFTTRQGERFAHVWVDDYYNNDEVIELTITQDADGDGSADHSYSVCSATDKALRIHGGVEVQVHVETIGCDGKLGATSGYVYFLFFESKKQLNHWQKEQLVAQLEPEQPSNVTGSERTVESTYYGPGGAGAADNDLHFTVFPLSATEWIGGAIFTAESLETYVRVEIKDASGLPARAQIVQTDSSGQRETLQTICGQSEAPIPIQPGAEITIGLVVGPCPDGSIAAVTRGTISATFITP